MRTVRVHGVSLTGAEAELVTVEARFERPQVDRGERRRTEVVLSGLPDAVIRESRGRLVSALEANGLSLGQGRLFLNLVPAGVRKRGEILDLPLAVGAAAASGHVDPPARTALFLGEVGIDGRLHAVPGGLAAAEAARRAGLTDLVGPPATAGEASALREVRAWSAASLGDVVAWVARGGEGLTAASARDAPPGTGGPGVSGAEIAPPATLSLDAIRGQEAAKHALCVAAAGGHALLLVGPPGTGKSLLARALVGLLPPPDEGERLEITRVLSAAGRWPGGLATARPFRAPHHTTSHAGLVGGGSPPGPGEITLAHRGVLFLDELPEFRRSTLESLRQPLEEGRITLARAGRRLDLPCRFQLVCAMNPCPCGHRGVPGRCSCSPAEVRRYRRRISGPLLDRIDLRVELPAPDLEALSARPAARLAAGRVAARVARARDAASRRGDGRVNARLDADALDAHAPLDADARRLLERARKRHLLSARALQSVRRVALTLADLDGDTAPSADHAARALALRAPLE